jgi:hypothetical protein
MQMKSNSTTLFLSVANNTDNVKNAPIVADKTTIKKNSASFHLHHWAFLLSVYINKVKYSKEKNSFSGRQNYINQIIKDN